MAHFRKRGGGGQTAYQKSAGPALCYSGGLRYSKGDMRPANSRYVDQRCCSAEHHIDNHSEEEISEVHETVRINSKACLMAAYPGCIILDPLRAFKGEEDTAVLSDLISSGGVSIWKEGDPVHLTQTAYGDIAEQIINTAAGKGGEDTAAPARKRLESIITRSATVQPK